MERGKAIYDPAITHCFSEFYCSVVSDKATSQFLANTTHF